MPTMWGIIRKSKMFNSFVKGVVRGGAKDISRLLARRSGFFGRRNVRV